MAKTNPLKFFREVRSETAKVTWPTRQETIITTVMVLMMVAAAALFFLGVDAVLSWLINTFVFGFGSIF